MLARRLLGTTHQVEGTVDAVIFLVDPLDKHPHEPDIQALLRLCNVHNVPLATNLATADCIIIAESLRVVTHEPIS
ncbi:MAG TPA: hypothetical protein VI793_05160 [Anaerolineales bacterium]|nr:hypothetical protein [Anaerolineales bacterium]